MKSAHPHRDLAALRSVEIRSLDREHGDPGRGDPEHGGPDGAMAAVAVLARALDGLGIALCVFDAEDRARLWNRAFLRFFPEHEGHVHAGEPYRRNLERFYASRLPENERQHIDRFVEDGIARHRAQNRPFVFEHRGRHLTVSSLPMPDGGRVRLWSAGAEAAGNGGPLPPSGWDPFAHLADGVMVLDGEGRIVAVNGEFLSLYDLPSASAAVGRGFRDVVRGAWTGHDGNGRSGVLDSFLDNARFAGAAFEVELPGDRWRRVIERRLPDGSGCFSHADITALKRQQRELREAYARLATLAVTDALTGIANRGHFETVLAEEMGRARREQRPLALLLVDIDHFKRINDRFGHPSGDACLRMVARRIEAAIQRPGDLAARFGGEEFAAILPSTDLQGAARVAETVRAAVAADRGHDFNALAGVSVSVGVAAVVPPPGGGAADAAVLIRRADEALYRAKRAGRNRVALAPG